MPSGEEIIQIALNAAGGLATTELLKQFDTDGSPLSIGSLRLTSKCQVEKEYETPYGKVAIKRHVYQTGSGGGTFCPLDKEARIIGSATPRLAKMISNKYSRNSVDEVKDDLKNNHGRDLARWHIQNIADQVGDIAISKEESWRYTPKIESEVTTIAIGMDGAMMLMKDDGYREAMSGTIAFYNKDGDRLHTDYIAAAPKYGKSKFLNRMTKEIECVKNKYPQAYFMWFHFKICGSQKVQASHKYMI